MRNEALAEQRRVMQEQASQWYTRRADSSDDEDGKGKRGKGRKKKVEDDFVNDGEPQEDKPKRAPKRKVRRSLHIMYHAKTSHRTLRKERRAQRLNLMLMTVHRLSLQPRTMAVAATKPCNVR